MCGCFGIGRIFAGSIGCTSRFCPPAWTDRSRGIPLSRNCSRFWPRPTTGSDSETRHWRLAGRGEHAIRKTRSCCIWKGFSIASEGSGDRRLGACKSWWEEKKKITAESAEKAQRRQYTRQSKARKLLRFPLCPLRSLRLRTQKITAENAESA